MREHNRPYLDRGVWYATVDAQILCVTCTHSKQMPKGGLVCTVDPRAMAMTRMCRQYERYPGGDDYRDW